MGGREIGQGRNEGKIHEYQTITTTSEPRFPQPPLKWPSASLPESSGLEVHPGI